MKCCPETPDLRTSRAKLLVQISLCLFFALQIYPAILFSQQPTQEWVARYFGPSNDLRGPYLAVDKLGNSYLAGTYVINDSINIMVAKYNSVGTQLWNTIYKYPGEGYFAPMAFAIDTSGNAYVTSKYGQSSLSYFNTLTVKFNAVNGSVVWAKCYIGGPRHNIPEDIKIDKNNNIYIVGASDSALLCIKYNTNGDSLWVRKYQPPGFSYANACTIDDSLNIIIAGTKTHCISIPPPGGCFDTLLTVKFSTGGEFKWANTYSYAGNTSFNSGLRITNDQFGSIYIGGKTRPNIGNYKYLTLKYNRNGIYQWASLYDGIGSGNDIIRAIFIDTVRNSLLVTGSSSGLGTDGDCTSIKYNATNGDSSWVRRFNGISNSFDNGNDLTIDNNGNLYVTGSTNTTTGVDILTLKYSVNGNQEWFTTFNSPTNGWDEGTSIHLDLENNIYICGKSSGDYVILKYSQLTGIQTTNNHVPFKYELFQNYPNPFNPSTKIRFDISGTSVAQTFLSVYDINGKEISLLVNAYLKPGSYEISFDATGLSSGVYFYKISVGSFTDVKKMVLLK